MPAAPTQADAPLTNATELHGKVAVVRRSQGSPFYEKARRAQEAGAVAVVVVNTEPGPHIFTLPNGPVVDIAIPAAASYAHTTFNDARVYLVGLATTAQVTVEFVKRGTSKLLDRNGKVPAPRAVRRSARGVRSDAVPARRRRRLVSAAGLDVHPHGHDPGIPGPSRRAPCAPECGCSTDVEYILS